MPQECPVGLPRAQVTPAGRSAAWRPRPEPLQTSPLTFFAGAPGTATDVECANADQLNAAAVEAFQQHPDYLGRRVQPGAAREDRPGREAGPRPDPGARVDPPGGPAAELGDDFILACGDIPPNPNAVNQAGTYPRRSWRSCANSCRCSHTALRPRDPGRGGAAHGHRPATRGALCISGRAGMAGSDLCAVQIAWASSVMIAVSRCRGSISMPSS
jgi:hypothetical protein